jgi:type IV pilus assembly protein PilM
VSPNPEKTSRVRSLDAATAIDGPAGFDPYRAWLGVREVRRPLSPYQLLGLPADEADVDSIHMAASQRRASLLAHRDEAPPEIWAQLYEELEAAIDTLLDPDKKVAYDLSRQMPADPAHLRGGSTARADRGGSGAQLTCRRCRAANPATRKFCAQCGANLWEPCSQCGTICATGERYCGACGANIEASIRQQIERIEADFEQVPILQAESRFGEAIELLAAVSRLDHPRLSEMAARAGEMIKQLAAQRDRRQLAVDEKLKEAELLVQRQRYSEALTLLESVPRALWTDAVRGLTNQCRACSDEIETLSTELASLLAAKRLDGMLPKIERLLTLQPEHAQAQQLARQIQTHLCRAAKDLLAKHQYEKAKQLLEQVPESVRAPAVVQYLAYAGEMSWMTFDIRTAPHIDKPLLAIAARFKKLAQGNSASADGAVAKPSPLDPAMTTIFAKLQQRVAAGIGSTLSPTPWAAAPQQPALGLPVDPVWTLKRLPFKDGLDAAPFAEQAGGFFAACGLALQGLGRGPIKANLVPADHRTMLGRMTTLVRFRARTAWGIDVSTSGIKAVKLAWDETKQQATIEAGSFLQHRKLLTQAVNEAEEERLLDETLRTLLELNDLRADRLCVGFSGRWLLYRQFKLPPIEGSKMAKLVQYEARLQVPVDLEDLVWDFQMVDELNVPAKDAGKETADLRRERDVGLIAVKQAQIKRLLARFQAHKLTADIVQSDAFALANALSYEHFPASPEPAQAGAPAPLAILDVGCDATNLICCGPQMLWVRNFGVGGQSITRAIVQQFQLTFAQAEELKREPANAPSISRLYEAMEPVFEDIVHETHASMTAMARIYPYARLPRMLAIGGGMRQHGLLRRLRVGR